MGCVMPDITLRILENPNKGSRFLGMYQAFNYRHTILANGWFDRAQCALNVDQSDGSRIFQYFLGKRVAAYADNPLVPIWEGYISRVNLSAGNVSLSRSLDEMFNAVFVQYNVGDGAAPDQTAKASNTDSIGVYGEKQTTWEMGETYTTDTTLPTAIRDAALEALKNPVVSTLAGQGSFGLTLELKGFYHTLGWDVAPLTASSDSINVVRDVLTDNGSSYSQNYGTFYDHTDTTRITTNPTMNGSRELGESSWDVVMRAVEAGDGSGARRVAGITPTNPNTGERIAYYEDANENVEYVIDAYGFNVIRSVQGNIIDPQWIRPNRKIRIANIGLGDADDVKTAYISQVDYDANANTVTWQTDDNTTWRGNLDIDAPILKTTGSPRSQRRQSASNDFVLDSLKSGVINTDKQLDASVGIGANANLFQPPSSSQWLVFSNTNNTTGSAERAMTAVFVSASGTISLSAIVAATHSHNVSGSDVRVNNGGAFSRDIISSWIRLY